MRSRHKRLLSHRCVRRDDDLVTRGPTNLTHVLRNQPTAAAAAARRVFLAKNTYVVMTDACMMSTGLVHLVHQTLLDVLWTAFVDCE